MLEVLPNDEQYKLRAFLFKKNAPTLIATSTSLYEGFSDYRAPFYDAFRVLHISQLAQNDIAEILSEDVFQKVKDLSEFQNTIPKLGGNLNYIRSLAAALCENRGIEAVVKANDRYFRYMFSSLPNVQQRALYGLALSGETATSADVQKMSGLTAANTASALFRLEKQGIIAKIGDKKRNVTYQINDYLLWLWITNKK
jgi:Fic family protein